jgi:hypothetical protein
LSSAWLGAAAGVCASAPSGSKQSSAAMINRDNVPTMAISLFIRLNIRVPQHQSLTTQSLAERFGVVTS